MPLSTKSIVFDKLSADPASPAEGQIWYNTTDKLWKIRRNNVTTSFVDLTELEAHTNDTDNPHATTLELARLAGDTLDGPIDMGGNAITNIGEGSTGSDAAQRQWVLDQLSNISSTVTSVGATAPITSSGGSNPTIAITAATTGAAGSMSAADKTKLDGIGAGATVVSVGATGPVTSTGGANPTIGIDAATTLAAGSMSAADKTKLDGITAGAAVASVGASAPITSTGGTTPTIGIDAATSLSAGSMSAADKSKLDAITTVVSSVGASAPITSTGGTTPSIGISAATTAAAGSMSAADKTKLDGIGAGATVVSVGATGPVTSTGGANPTIGIDAATTLAAGSMSAADKTKLDGITAGAAVASVGASAPITSTGGTTPTIGISAATTAAAGSMSAADKTKLDGLSISGTDGNVLFKLANNQGITADYVKAGTGYISIGAAASGGVVSSFGAIRLGGGSATQMTFYGNASDRNLIETNDTLLTVKLANLSYYTQVDGARVFLNGPVYVNGTDATQYPSAGDVRMPSASSITAKDSTVTNDLTLLQLASDTLYLGTSSALNKQCTNARLYATTTVHMGLGPTAYFLANTTNGAIINTGSLKIGSSGWAVTGALALVNGALIKGRNFGASADLPIAGTNSSDQVVLGDNALLITGSSSIAAKSPIIGSSGYNSAYAVHGTSSQAMADANQTPTSSVYASATIKLTGSLTADRTVTLPDATDGASYDKVIDGAGMSGSFGAVIRDVTGTGARVRVPARDKVRVQFDGRGVTPVTQLTDLGICQFRLTTESGVAISTSDRTSQGTLYLTPFNGNRITLYDTTRTLWIVACSAQISKALNYNGSLTTGKPYDVFAFLTSNGAVDIEFLAWTNDTTRATALVDLDGVLVKSGDNSRRYVGSFYTNGTNVTEDSVTTRYVYSAYNQVIRSVDRLLGSNLSSTSSTTFADVLLGNVLLGLTGTISMRGNLSASKITNVGNGRLRITVDSSQVALSAMSAAAGSVIHLSCARSIVYGAGRRGLALQWATNSASLQCLPTTNSTDESAQFCADVLM